MNARRNTAYSTENGFTLVEMAIVLVIVGLLIGGGFSTLGAYLDNAKQSHTLGSLKVTKQALLNYVKVNKHMPCPDIDGDGKGDSGGTLGTQCSSDVGTIPFDDIGIGKGIASDDYGNLFGYGIHKEAANPEIMKRNIAVSSEATELQGFAGSYFYNIGAPAFNLDTPPTEALPGSAVNSYQVCNRNASNDCSGANDIEVQFIPAVIVAFNENGGVTDLKDCTGSRGAREFENCNADMLLMRGFFQEGVFDDQIVTISAYEIKENALGDFKDPPRASIDNSAYGAYEGYDVIIKGDVDSANVLNIQDGLDNAVFIDKSDKYQDQKGSLSANVNFGKGNDTLYVAGNVESKGNANMGDGDDIVFIKGGILFQGSVDLGKDNDTATIGGSVGGKLFGGPGEDVVTVEGDVTGSIDLGDDNDTLYIMGNLVGGKIDGGKGTTNTLYVAGSDVAGAVDEFNVGGTISNFQTIYYNHPF